MGAGIPWAHAQNTLENTVPGYILKNTVPISPETLLKIWISSRSETYLSQCCRSKQPAHFTEVSILFIFPQGMAKLLSLWLPAWFTLVRTGA